MSSPDIVTIISILPQVAQLQDLESSGATTCGINAHNNQFATPTNPNPPSWSYLLFVMYLQTTYFEIFLHLYVAQCIKFHISNDKYEVCTCPCSCQISNIRYASAVVKYQVCHSYCQIPGMPQLFSNMKYNVCPSSSQI